MQLTHENLQFLTFPLNQKLLEDKLIRENINGLSS